MEASINLHNQNTVWLNFSKNIEAEKFDYSLDDGKLFWQGKERTNKIVIIVDSQDTAKRTAKAFNRVIELCKENVKEPF